MSQDGEDVRELDVREVDGAPFGDIVAALESLSPGETLVVVNGFEPVPLYGVLDERGFEFESEAVSDDEWRVRIWCA